MAAQFQIQRQSQASSPSDPSNFADLDSQTQRGSYHGLAAAATIYSGAYLMSFISDWFTQLAADKSFQLPGLFESIVTAVAVGYALYVAYWCRRRECEACMFIPVAITFLAVSALGIALQDWGWEREAITANSVGTAAWVGVWIVAYPSVVTLPPKQFCGRHCSPGPPCRRY